MKRIMKLLLIYIIINNNIFILFYFFHMNTIELQELHSEEYVDFFSYNTVVFSLPFCMVWMGSSDEASVIHIKQSIPLRIFIWIRKVSSPWIHLKNFRSYSHFRKKFFNRIMPDYLPPADMYIRRLLKEIPTNEGVELSILSECWRTLGFGIHTLVLFSIFLARKWLDNNGLFEQMNQECTKTPHEAIWPETFLYKLLIEHQRILKKIQQDSGFMILVTCLLGGAYPIVSYTTTERNNHVFAFSLRDFLGEYAPEYPHSSYEQSIYFPGLPYLYENYIRSNNPEKIDVNEPRKIMHEVMNKYHENYAEEQIPDYLSFSSDISHENFTSILMRLKTYKSMQIFQAMIQAHKHELSRKNSLELITLLEQRISLDILKNNVDENMKQCYHDIWEKFHDKSHPAIFPNITLWSWGCFNIISPPIVHQDIMRELSTSMSDNYPDGVTIYRSWKDGLELHGFVLEQDISQKHYHKLTEKNIGLCTVYNEVYPLPQSHLEGFSKGKIIFDLTNQKIYVDWHIVTSTQIPSQKATIEILKLLLHAPNNILTNSELPRSIYSSMKSEMNWKIISPINKLYHDITGELFPLILEGSLSNFTLQLTIKENKYIGFFVR